MYRRNFELRVATELQTHENSEFVNNDMNYIDDLARIKDEFGTLQVGNEAGLIGLRHDLLNVITLAITDKQIADRYVKQVNSIWFHPQAIFVADTWGGGPSAGPDLRGPWNEGSAEMVAVIESIANHLQRFAKDAVPAAVPAVAPRNKVFIVHGHDHGMLNAVEAFVRKIGVEAVVLKDEANRGGTVIEKFERYSDVPFAIILLSPDTRVGHDQSRTTLYDRARARMPSPNSDFSSVNSVAATRPSSLMAMRVTTLSIRRTSLAWSISRSAPTEPGNSILCVSSAPPKYSTTSAGHWFASASRTRSG